MGGEFGGEWIHVYVWLSPFAVHQKLWQHCEPAVSHCQHLLLGCLRLFATPWTVAHQAPLSMDSPGENTGVGCHSLLQGIFATQRLNPGILHCRQILYCQATKETHMPIQDKKLKKKNGQELESHWTEPTELSPRLEKVVVFVTNDRGEVGIRNTLEPTLSTAPSSAPRLAFSPDLSGSAEEGWRSVVLAVAPVKSQWGTLGSDEDVEVVGISWVDGLKQYPVNTYIKKTLKISGCESINAYFQKYQILSLFCCNEVSISKQKERWK